MTHYYQRKDPNEVLDYVADWSDFLESGESITTSQWILVPDSLTKDSDTNTSATATIVVSGGTHGQTYHMTNRIVTDGSPIRTVDRVVVLKVWGIV